MPNKTEGLNQIESFAQVRVDEMLDQTHAQARAEVEQAKFEQVEQEQTEGVDAQANAEPLVSAPINR